MASVQSMSKMSRAGRCAAVAAALMLSAAGLPAVAQYGPPPAGAEGNGPPAPPPGGPPDGISGQLPGLPPPSPEILAQYPPNTDPHNFEGVWLADQKVFMTRMMVDPRTIPYTDAARAELARKMQLQQEASAKGLAVLSDAGRCRPMGGLSIGADLFPTEVIQTRDKVVLMAEEGRGRWVIHLDQKVPPANLKPTYFGYSLGHWEGNELVVETYALRHTDSLFSVGLHTDGARIVSRLSKSADGTRLTMKSTIYDPKTYTRPYETPQAQSTWHPELQVLEFQCEENRAGASEGMIKSKE